MSGQGKLLPKCSRVCCGGRPTACQWACCACTVPQYVVSITHQGGGKGGCKAPHRCISVGLSSRKAAHRCSVVGHRDLHGGEGGRCMPLPTRWCSSGNPLSFLSTALPVCLSVCLPPVSKSRVLKAFKGRCRTLSDNLRRRLGTVFVMDNGQCWTICVSPSGVIPEGVCHCRFVGMLRVTAATKLPSYQATTLPSY